MPDSPVAGSTLLFARVCAVATIATLAVLFVSAGIVAERASALDVHGAGAVVLHVTTCLLALALALRAWVTRTGIGAAAIALVVCGLTFVQAALGSYATLALHVSGSLVIAVSCSWLAIWTCRPRATIRRGGSPRDDEEPVPETRGAP